MTKLNLFLNFVFLILILFFLFEIFLINEIKKNKSQKSEFRFRQILSIFFKLRIILLLVLIGLIATMNQTGSLKFKGSSFGKPLVMTARDPETFAPVEVSPMFPDKTNKKGLMPNTSLGARHLVRHLEKGVRITRATEWTTLAAQKALNFLGGGCAVMDPVTQVETSLNTPLTLGPGPQGRFGFLMTAFVSNRFHIVVVRKVMFIAYRRVLAKLYQQIVQANQRRARDENNRRAQQERDRRDREQRDRLYKIRLASDERRRITPEYRHRMDLLSVCPGKCTTFVFDLLRLRFR